MKINACVDGVPVSMFEARKVIVYLIKHRKEFNSDDDVRNAFDSFVRKLRGGNEK